jgi:phenylalanyl-tRNA synthetase beta chain
VDINLDESSDSVGDAIDVSILNSDACSRYTARVLKDVVIKESDPVIRSRLNAIGVRAINNIVDITNYVMFVYGQPLHAFDYDLIRGRKIIVRYASDGEKFVTLDEKERVLTSRDLLICDGERGAALGGVMGGMNTEVSDKTKNILLESAYFDPITIRKTSKRLGLSSESSHRFERGVNPQTVTRAIDYAASLIQSGAGCEVLKGIADEHLVKYEDKTIKVRFNRVNKVIGTDFANSEILELLERLRLEIKEQDEEQVELMIPQARHDLIKEIDIIEDIARIYGYNNIKVTLPKVPAVSKKKSVQDALEENIRALLVGNGFYEVINYSFYAPKDLEFFSFGDEDKCIKILNPLTEEQSVMRMSLLAGLIDTVKRNINHKNVNLKLFELGRTYKRYSGEKIEEPNELAGIISGFRYKDDWSHEKNYVDFFDIKGIVELVLENIKVIGYILKNGSSKKYLHPAISAEFYMGDELFGVIGELHPGTLEYYDIDKKVYAFEFDFNKLCKYAKKELIFKQLPKYPYVKRDIAIILDKDIACDEILKEIRACSEKLVEDVAVFDLYEGRQIGDGKKSIAIRITYRDLERTLTDDVVNEIIVELSDRLEKKFNGQVRK